MCVWRALQAEGGTGEGEGVEGEGQRRLRGSRARSCCVSSAGLMGCCFYSESNEGATRAFPAATACVLERWFWTE